ncbi:metallophosphoesterase [Streptomyces sp. BPTC-684]|uniref:metallophosphoesterase n=1 Tax=Streptomyces sp. BPTC-684 TaxID=3043734 RepID=UPI0024B201FB|nr:metallophosphoesterase [Streptomyces sp. BPTC-684]WHM37297.1 metallophosphoesterase [Streptomyces sp. BPTC-684]
MLLAHISDLHLEGGARAAERAARVVTYINAMSRRPDAVLVTGDIADHGAPAEYAEAAELLARIDAPVLTCPGNHDDRAAYRKGLLDLPGEPGGTAPEPYAPVNRLHRVGGYAILMCDSTIPGEDGGALEDSTLEWLARTLDTLGDTPALIAFHHPPTVIHHEYLDSINLSNADRLAELLAGRTQVPAILVGHAHTSAATTFAGLPLLIAPGVTSTLRMPWETGEDLVNIVSPPGVAFHVLDEDRRIMSHFRVVERPDTQPAE